jgi:hypothetical protein
MATISNFMRLSTAHIPEHVINQPGGLDAIDGVIAFAYPEGAWLLVPDDVDDFLEAEGYDAATSASARDHGTPEPGAQPRTIPELEWLWRYAREHDCDAIRLDADEEKDPKLPTYEWPTPSCPRVDQPNPTARQSRSAHRRRIGLAAMIAGLRAAGGALRAQGSRHDCRVQRTPPPLPEPPPIELEIISVRAIVGGHLTGPYQVHWRGALYMHELERFAPAARKDGRAGFHQALRRYFTTEPVGGRERLAAIGYTMPSLDEGDILLIGALAFIVTLEGEFKLATHNPGIAHYGLLEVALRDRRCRLADPYGFR